MGKERQSESINSLMPLDDQRFWGRVSVPKFSPIGTLVMTKPFRFNAGIASVFYRLRINDE
jgi:hypothetical protein